MSKQMNIYRPTVPAKVLGGHVAGHTIPDAFQEAGLNFHVTKQPLRTSVNQLDIPVRGHFATVRRDSNIPLGVVGARYSVVQNTVFQDIVKSFMDFTDLHVETAGTYKDGEKVWFQASLPDYIDLGLGGKDRAKRYFTFLNSFDGSTPVVVKFSTIMIVCENTMFASFKESAGRDGVAVPHFISAQDRLKAAAETLGLANKYWQLTEAAFKKMSVATITDRQLVNYVNDLVFNSPEITMDTEISRRALNQRDRVLELYQTGRGAEMRRGTVWGAYNAVTEYTDHVSGGDNDERALASMWFGSASKMKEKAFNKAMELIAA